VSEHLFFNEGLLKITRMLLFLQIRLHLRQKLKAASWQRIRNYLPERELHIHNTRRVQLKRAAAAPSRIAPAMNYVCGAKKDFNLAHITHSQVGITRERVPCVSFTQCCSFVSHAPLAKIFQ
jgi:hypothetical protein